MKEGAAQAAPFFMQRRWRAKACLPAAPRSGAARARLAFDPGAATVQFRQAPHQRKSQPRPARLTVIAIVHLAEGREDVVDLLAGNAGPIVPHTMIWKPPSRAVLATTSTPAFRREFHRIGHQIDQYLTQGAFVGEQGRAGRIHINGEELIFRWLSPRKA